MTLVERGPHLAALDRHLAAAAAGHGHLVVVGGEAGVGKTALVRTFVVEQASVRVLWGACDGLFTPQPLAPLRDIAPELGLEVDGPPRQVFAATLEALRGPPTVLVFEDVHWADEATLDLVRFLARRLDSTRTLLIATYRDDEIGARHPLRAVLAGVETARRISVEPLTEEAVRALAEGSEVDPDELYRLSGGNPFFVTEVLAARSAGVPASVRDAVLARAAALPPSAREALDVAAAIGQRVEVDLLETLLSDASGAVEICVGAGVLQAEGTLVAFRHELSHRAIDEALDPVRRLSLHRRVLGALAQRGGTDPARLAHHAEGAGDAAAVLEHAPAAAARAATLGAHREAAAQYARAVRFADNLPPLELARLLERLGDESALTEQLDEAGSAYARALGIYRELGEERKQGEMLLHEAQLAYLRADSDESLERATAAIRVLEPLGPSRELALAYSSRSRSLLLDLDLAGALRGAGQARELAEQLGDEEIAMHAASTIASAREMRGGPTTATEEILATSLERGWDARASRAYTHLVFRAVRARDWAAADRWVAEALAFARERDLDGMRAYVLSWSARAALDRGRWDDAATALADAEAGNRTPLNLIWVLSVLSLLRARRGDPGVWEACDEAWAVARRSTASEQRLLGLRTMRAEAAVLAGSPGRALAEAGTLPVSELVDRWAAGENAVWRVRAGGDLGDPGDLPQPFALELAGDHRGAAAAWERLDVPYEAAWALAGSNDEGELRRSHELFRLIEARPAAAIVARRLRERGVRGIARGPRRTTGSNPAGLTPREVEVLALLTEGLRDAEIAERLVITEKTVGHHVSAILRKLRVRSRYDAVRAARDALAR